MKVLNSLCEQGKPSGLGKYRIEVGMLRAHLKCGRTTVSRECKRPLSAGQREGS